ncbi:MAG: pyrroline-5-carboxylate reductase [Oscillospiraceae bacterium]|nr:pyrroline-5-carboxylate reductase [Oscillospiraceae bacterium]
MTLGFIGCGNMAKAIITQIIKTGYIRSGDVSAHDIDIDALNEFCRLSGINKKDSAQDIIEASDAVILAVKPQNLNGLLPEIAQICKTIANGNGKKNPLVISIAAGKTLKFYEGFFGYPAKIVRVFPNMNAGVGASVTAYCPNGNVNADETAEIHKFCESFGSAYLISEDIFPAFGVLTACAPAYTFMYIGALAAAAAENGVGPELALKAAAEMAKGSAITLSSAKTPPSELVNKVCSKGGTTIEGVDLLKAGGFEEIVNKAYRASLEKDKKM